MYTIDVTPWSAALNDIVVRPATEKDTDVPLYEDLGDAVRAAMRLEGFLRIVDDEGKVERSKLMHASDWQTIQKLMTGEDFKGIYVKENVPVLSGDLIEVQQVFRTGTAYSDKPVYLGTFFRFESKGKDGFRAPLWQYFVFVAANWKILHKLYTIELQKEVAAFLNEKTVQIIRYTVLKDGTGAARIYTETRQFPT